MTPSQIVSQIKTIIQKLIEAGLSNHQNFPVLRSTGSRSSEISISGAPNLSISMKDIPYAEIYEALEKAGAYHIRMIDGALLQMCYRFQRGRLGAHRLCLFPAPHLELYDIEPEVYENDELYADIISRSIVHVPIRIDYDSDPCKHVDVKHPKCHLTLGQYPNCRIPVSAPVSPARFIKFVLRNFYSTAFDAAGLERIDSAFLFDDTVTKTEKSITHIVC